MKMQTKNSFVDSAVVSAVASAFVFVLGVASADPLTVTTQYQTLSNAHHVDQLMGLYADEARLDFGPIGVVEGKQQIRGIHEYDRALGTQLAFSDCHQEANIVRCRTREENQWLKTAGIDAIHYDETAIQFDASDRISAVSARLAPESAQRMGAAMAQLDAWARKNASEQYLMLFSESGQFQFSYDNGIRILALLRQWRESQGENR